MLLDNNYRHHFHGSHLVDSGPYAYFYIVPDALLYKAQKDSLVGTNLGHCRYHLIRQGNALACGPYYSPHISGQYITGVEKLNQFLVFYLDVNFGGRLVLLD